MAGELERLLVRLEADTSMLRRELLRAEKDVSGFAKNTNKRMQETERGFAALGKEMRGAFQGIAAGVAVRELATLSDSYQNLQNRLRTVTGSQKQMLDVQRQLLALSQETRSDLAGNVEIYTRFAGALKGTGTSTKELIDFTSSLNKAVALSGATSTEALGALIQLSQGMGAGALRGQELNSVLEQLPRVADVIADGMGVSRGELKKLGEQGAITGQMIIDAFEKAREQIDEDFKRSASTISQALTVAKNSFLNLFGELAQSSGANAAVVGGIKALADALDYLARERKKAVQGNLTEWWGGMAGSAEDAGAAIDLVIAKLRDPPDVGAWSVLDNVFGGAADRADKLRQRLAELYAQFEQLSPKDSELLNGLSGIASQRLSGARAWPKEQGDWKTELDFSSVDALASLEKHRLEALGMIGQAAQLEYEGELEGFRRMLAEKTITEGEFATARSHLSDALAQKIKDNLGAETEAQREYFSEIRGMIENDFMGAFSEVLETGKFKAEQFFARLTSGFAEMTMQALVLKPIMDSLFSGASGGLGSVLGSMFAPARAAGGPVAGGRPYLVGERGPEMFVPNTAGGVMSATRTAGAMGNTFINQIDARGADISVAQRIERALAASERSRRDPVSSVTKQQRRFPNRAA